MKNELKIVALSKLFPAIRRQMENLRDHCSSLHKKKKTRQEQIEHLDRYCSRDDIKCWILAYDQDLLIGRIAIFLREIKWQGKKILLGGIGKVKVRDDYRRQGVASAMMKRSMIKLKRLKADIAFLNTDFASFLPYFYAKYGFKKMDQPYAYISRSGKRYSEENGMIAAVCDPTITKKIHCDNLQLDLGQGNW